MFISIIEKQRHSHPIKSRAQALLAFPGLLTKPASFSPWAKTPKIGFFVPIGGTSAIMEFFNLNLSKFKKIYDIKAESVAILVI